MAMAARILARMESRPPDPPVPSAGAYLGWHPARTTTAITMLIRLRMPSSTSRAWLGSSWRSTCIERQIRLCYWSEAAAAAIGSPDRALHPSPDPNLECHLRLRARLWSRACDLRGRRDDRARDLPGGQRLHQPLQLPGLHQ